MSAKKPISSKLRKQETDQQVSNIINEQNIEKDQNKISRKRMACSLPRINNGVFKKSKQNLNKSDIKPATSSDSDDDEMDDDSDDTSDDALDEKILDKSNVSKQTKDKKLAENSDEDDSFDEDNSENDDDDVESDSGKDEEQEFSPKKISGKRVNEVESGDEDSDDQSDSEDGSDENSSNDSEDERLGNDQTAAVNSVRTGVSSEKTGLETSKNQHSVIKDDKQTEASDDSNAEDDDSDEDSSEDDDEDADNSKLEDDISDEEIVENETNPEDELEAVKKELANIPLEDLMKIKEKLGLKVFNKIMHGGKFDEKKNKVFKRENKNRPMELSSKRRVRMLRQTDVPKEKVRRDPRFDDLSGEYQDQHFTKNYSFLSDIKAKEKLLIQKKMKKTTDENKKQEMAKLLNRMTQQEQADETKRKRMELEKQWKEKERQHIKEGKTPYFLKKSDKKKLELAEKFKELQKSGQIDTYMSKRLKKNAQKEKKKLPGRHQRLT